MPGVELPGTAPTIGDKRKVAQSGPSAEGKAKRMRKPGPTILNARKAELGKQFENIFDWASRKHVSSEYTAEQYKRDETQLKEAVSLFGSKIEPEGQEQHCQNQLFKVEGMKNTIRDYQVVGAGFMLRQERSRNDCRGAIIADDMGIGKTIQSIACMLANQPSKKAREEHRSATLIVVPNQGVLKQWSEELKEWGGVDMGREICRYTGGGKMGAVGLQGYPYVYAWLSNSLIVYR
jgi:SNF2 family DNA or RNA helicase